MGVPGVEMEGRPVGGRGKVLLEVRDLKTYYSLRGSFGDRLLGREAGQVKAVDGVSFDLDRGEILGDRKSVV